MLHAVERNTQRLSEVLGGLLLRLEHTEPDSVAESIHVCR
jgi:hypothetical protein